MKKTTKTSSPLGTKPEESWDSGKGANRITLFNSTAGKCTPMQVIKQTEHGRTSKIIIILQKVIIRNNVGLC